MSSWREKLRLRSWKDRKRVKNSNHGRSASDAEVIVEEAEEDDKTILQAPQRAATAVLSRLDDFRSLPVSLTNDPVGLQVLHQPDAPHVVDIIFVHGLGGGSRTTWTQHQDPEFLWPLKFLPHESKINEARISTFGYHTDLKKASIFELAKALLVDLKHAEDAITKQPLAIGKRPIIFVAHSLGGLIVKEAYREGEHHPNYHVIIRAIVAVLFLATPHRGGDLTTVIQSIMQVFYLSGPLPSLVELASGPQSLLKLNEHFANVARNLKAISFCETRKTMGRNGNDLMVLRPQDAMFSHPGEEVWPMEGKSHLDIATYKSAENDQYLMIAEVLKRCIVQMQRELVESDPTAPVLDLNLEDYLAVTEFWEHDYSFFRDRRTAKTCRWILEDPHFSDWINDEQEGLSILWVYGSGGCGKSVLSSFIIEHITNTLEAPCQYFFVRFQDVKKRGLSSLLRSLACQLAPKIPAYKKQLVELHSANPDLRTVDTRSLFTLLFKESFRKLEVPFPIYWIVDGVDEAEHPDAFLKILQELKETRLPLRIAIISRKERPILTAFNKLGKLGIRTDLMLVQGHGNDFERYIEEHLDEIVIESKFGESIQQQLLARADGNFLWLHFAVEKINGRLTMAAISNALDDLPHGMEGFYRRMAVSISAQQDLSDWAAGREILGWAVGAQRLLSIAELGEAIEAEVLHLQSSIETLCGGFVVVDQDGRVAMIHESARDYLRTAVDDLGQPIANTKAINDMLFSRCMARLCQHDLRVRVESRDPPPLLEYAASSWFTHMVQGNFTEPRIMKIVIGFLQSYHVLDWLFAVAHDGRLGILIRASRGLTAVLSEIQKLSIAVLAEAEIELLRDWIGDLVKIVGKFGSNLCLRPDSIYELVAPFCPAKSAIFKQFGHRESYLRVTSSLDSKWDDCLGRLPLDQGAMPKQVLTAGSRLLIMATIGGTGMIYVFSSSTMEEQTRFRYPERLLMIQVNKLGNRVVGYGYQHTAVWDITSDEPIAEAKNLATYIRPQTLVFTNNDCDILMGATDRTLQLLCFKEEHPQWVIITKIEEKPLENYVYNLPSVSALNHDGTMIAFGYRSYPTTVWMLNPPKHVGQCFIKRHEDAQSKGDTSYIPDVVALTWRPVTNEIFGLDLIGQLFKWDSRSRYVSNFVMTQARNLTMSQDGWLLATGDSLGTIKVFTTSELALIYQLAIQDPVLNIALSPDSRRLYDIRITGAYGTAWEPDALVKFVESFELDDRLSSNAAIDIAAATANEALVPAFARVDTVIAVAGQATGTLYAYGTDGGAVILCEVGVGRVLELAKLPRFMASETLAWSCGGHFIAIADLNGNIAVRQVNQTDSLPKVYDVELQYTQLIPRQKGGKHYIRQLLFHHTTNELFVYTASDIFRLDSTGQIMNKVAIRSEYTDLQWIWHPTDGRYLLGFGGSAVLVVSWAKLQLIGIWHYMLAAGSTPFTRPTSSSASTITRNSPLATRSSTLHSRPSNTAVLRRSSASTSELAAFHEDLEQVGSMVHRVLSTPGSTKIFVAMVHSRQIGAIARLYLVVSLEHTGDLDDDPDKVVNSEMPDHLSNVPCMLVPADMAGKIREPLALSSSLDLIYLDNDRWICSSKLRLHSHGKTQPSSSKADITEHYFLPSDWVAGNESDICTIMHDGTLLCPRNGIVISVECSELGPIR